MIHGDEDDKGQKGKTYLKGCCKHVRDDLQIVLREYNDTWINDTSLRLRRQFTWRYTASSECSREWRCRVHVWSGKAVVESVSLFVWSWFTVTFELRESLAMSVYILIRIRYFMGKEGNSMNFLFECLPGKESYVLLSILWTCAFCCKCPNSNIQGGPE